MGLGNNAESGFDLLHDLVKKGGVKWWWASIDQHASAGGVVVAVRQEKLACMLFDRQSCIYWTLDSTNSLKESSSLILFRNSLNSALNSFILCHSVGAISTPCCKTLTIDNGKRTNSDGFGTNSNVSFI